MYQGKMDDKELRQNLTALNITLGEACNAIENRAGIIISSRHIQTDLDRTGRLSAPMTAALRMFFREQRNGHQKI